MDAQNQNQAGNQNPAAPVPVLVQNTSDYGDILKSLNEQLARVSSSLASQGVKNIVQVYDGKPSSFREWTRSIEKYQQLSNLELGVCKMLAYQTSTGAVSGFISRHLEQNPGCTWASLKCELEKRFSDVTDTSLALSMLRQIKQKYSENIQVYAERIRSLAEIAFRGQDGVVVQTQLVDIFVNGLCSEQHKLTILRKHPATLDAALGIATDEQNLRQRVNLAKPFDTQQAHTSQKHEPMDVSHMRRVKCFKCGKSGHNSQECRNVRSVHSQPFVCWGCGQEGHIIRNCPEHSSMPPAFRGRPRVGQRQGQRPSGHGRLGQGN